MVTVSDILQDVDRGILANNMVENMFSYRVVYFINENGIGKKFYIDTLYGGLRTAMVKIIRNNLSTTNSVVVSAVTARKNGEVVFLLSRPYGFSLDGYFQQIVGEREKDNVNSNCRRRRANWC